MHPRLLNFGEIAAAIALLGVGLFMIFEGSGYHVGTARRMGPGFFPIGVGAILVCLGGALVWRALRIRAPVQSFDLRPLAAVTSGIVAFALTAPRLGLVPSTLLLVLLSSLGERRFLPLTVGLLALALCAIGYAVFVRGLGVPLPIIRW